MSANGAAPLDGKRILVTGAARGLGAAIVKRLIADGARVIAGVRGAPFTPTTGAESAVIPLDVTDESSVQRAFEWIDQNHEGLDVLATIARELAIFKRTWMISPRANSRRRSRPTSPAPSSARVKRFRLMASARGAPHSLTGVDRRRDALSGGASAYAASKAGLEALSASFNHEGAARRVRSTLLRLGACATELMLAVPGLSAADMLAPDEVARVVSFIACQPLDLRIDSMTLLPPKGVL